MGAELCRWWSRERVSIDTAQLSLLRRSVGDQRTREILDEVAFHLSDRMVLLRRAVEAGRLSEARALTDRLAALAEQIGLDAFVRVAGDLGPCLRRGQGAARDAVLARLERLAEASLRVVLDYADQSAL